MIQKKLEKIGKYGCYLLCLLHLGRVEENILSYYDRFLRNRWIDEDCTILDPCSIIWCVLGKRVKVVKSTEKKSDAFIEIQYWYNKRTGLHHFTLPDWDPLGESVTRAEGYIESYRYFFLR